MNDKILYFAIVLTLCFSCFIIGAWQGISTVRESAIKANVAHWTINSTNGNVKFEFKELNSK